MASEGRRGIARVWAAGLLALATAWALPAAYAAADTASGTGPHAIYYGDGCQSNQLPRNDDGYSGQVSLDQAFPQGMNFFGQTYHSLYVNNNGNVTFQAPMSTYTPFPLLTTQTPMIAPFFGDVDTRGTDSDVVKYGTTTFEGRPAFCALWAGVGVGYYSAQTDKLNSFELLLVNRSDRGAGDFDIVFNYDQVQWEAGSASGGVDGLGGTPARAGYSNGVDRALELPGSGQAGALLDSNTVTGLIHNQSGQGVSGDQQLGRYVFPVQNGQGLSAGSIAGTVTSAANSAPVSTATVSACGGDDPATQAVEQTCQVTQSNSSGGYVLAGLPAGDYNVRVSPPGDLIPQQQSATVNGSAVTVDFSLVGPVPPPAGTTIGNGNTTSGGTPVVVWYTPFDVRVPCAGPSGTGTVQFLMNGNPLTVYQGDGSTQTVTLAPDGSGHLVATGIVFHDHGTAQVVLTLSGCGANDGTSQFDIYIDPSGRVVDQYSRPVTGATVTLLRSDSADGPFTAVPNGSTIMDPSNRVNPMPSGSDGSYGWNTVPGYYRIQATPPTGCSVPGGGPSVQSDVLTVPPAQTDVNLALQCTDAVALTPASGSATTGTAQILTAALTRGGGTITTGSVLFTVTGANPTTGSVPVNGSSQAPFTYTGAHAGTDTITACYDRDGNGSCDAGEPTGSATRTWAAPVTGATCNGLPATIVSNAATVNGTAGNDVIVGGPASQQINGLGGDDVICGGDGNDVVSGGDGNDWLDGQGGMDMVIGGAGNDIEHGGALMDKIGGAGNDPGLDQLFGDGSSDQCFGATGVDVFDTTCELLG